MDNNKSSSSSSNDNGSGTLNNYNNLSSNKWADLPKELLEIIGKHPESRIDVFRFRAVSKSWRSVVSPSFRQSSLSPPLNLPPPIAGVAALYPVTICRLEDQSRTSACLVKVVESSNGNLFLLNPLSFHFRLPSRDDRICKSLNMLDFRLIELSKGYYFNSSNISLRKTLLFYNRGVLALHNKSGKLGYLGFGDSKWTELGKEGTQYDDIIVYKNQFYVIDNLGIISWIDKSLNLIQYSPPLCGFGQVKNLVESKGQFYVVDSYTEEEDIERQNPVYPQEIVRNIDRNCKVDMKVYKLDEEWGEWVEVKTLEDGVFVLGKETSFSVSVKDYPGCLGNCIYFSDPKTARLRPYVGRVFRLDDGSIKTVECFPTYKRLFSPAMLWPFSTSSSPLHS